MPTPSMAIEAGSGTAEAVTDPLIPPLAWLIVGAENWSLVAVKRMPPTTVEPKLGWLKVFVMVPELVEMLVKLMVPLNSRSWLSFDPGGPSFDRVIFAP